MNKHTIVGIAGGSGSGKSTLSEGVKRHYGDRCVVIAQDNYYRCMRHLAFPDRANVNYDHPDAIDSILLAEHLRALKGGQTVRVPVYDFSTHTRLKGRGEYVEPSELIVIEGIMLFANEQIRRELDYKLFIDAEPDARFIRRMMRDINLRGRQVDSVVEQYLNFVKPMHRNFIEPTKKYADLIVESNDEDNPLSVVLEFIGRTLDAE